MKKNEHVRMRGYLGNMAQRLADVAAQIDRRSARIPEFSLNFGLINKLALLVFQFGGAGRRIFAGRKL